MSWIKKDRFKQKRTREHKSIQQVKTKTHKEKDKEVKKRCRDDQNKYNLERTNRAEEAARGRDSKKLFHIVKELTGNTKV